MKGQPGGLLELRDRDAPDRGGRRPSPQRIGACATTVAILAALVVSGCGGDDGGGEEQAQTSRGSVGEARVATNGPADDLLRGSGEPQGGIVQGEPPSQSTDPPAAVEAPRRSCTGGELDPTAQNLPQVASATLCLLNVERQTRGLRPLRSNGRLARAARLHSLDMVRRSYFAHDSTTGSTFVDRIKRVGYLAGPERWVVGENLGWGGGSRATPRAIVDAWMNSPPHRTNILQRRFREIGLGIVLGAPVGSNGSAAATYSTNFGARV